MYDAEECDKWTSPSGDKIHDQQILQKKPRELSKQVRDAEGQVS